MNIVLIGYRCSGKTEVGKILASKLRRDFVDTDALIEQRTGCSVESIVSSKGWRYFREIERCLIGEVGSRDNLVVATGGGVVMDQENVDNLRRNGWIVWLKGNGGALKERMDRDQRSGKIRPSLTGAGPLQEIEEVLRMRKPLYQEAYDLAVDTTTLSVNQVAALIVKSLPVNRKRGVA